LKVSSAPLKVAVRAVYIQDQKLGLIKEQELVVLHGYSRFKNRNVFQSPHEEDSFMEEDYAVWVYG
jgi:hypothetical protein